MRTVVAWQETPVSLFPSYEGQSVPVQAFLLLDILM